MKEGKRLKPYSVVFIFNKDGTKVLLQKKNRTAFAGMLNGVGGKIEELEPPMTGALREVEEETTIRRGQIRSFTWLGNLIIPEQCDERNSDKYPSLHFFAGIVEDENNAQKAKDATEDVAWYMLNGNLPVTDNPLAGDGDIPYFIGLAKRRLFEA